jgi:hypothetical protein
MKMTFRCYVINFSSNSKFFVEDKLIFKYYFVFNLKNSPLDNEDVIEIKSTTGPLKWIGQSNRQQCPNWIRTIDFTNINPK